MNLRFKASIKVLLSAWMLVYSFLAVGHPGHNHLYSKADPGYCSSECQIASHHNVIPDCKGFPVNLLLGITGTPPIEDTFTPTLEKPPFIDERLITNKVRSTDRSRAPPSA